MRYLSTLAGSETTGAITKAGILAAVVATDQWIENNQSSYNTALPQPARGELTLTQKTLLFCVVATARVSLSFLRQLMGEVD